METDNKSHTNAPKKAKSSETARTFLDKKPKFIPRPNNENGTSATQNSSSSSPSVPRPPPSLQSLELPPSSEALTESYLLKFLHMEGR